MENTLNNNTMNINVLVVFNAESIQKKHLKPSLDKTMPLAIIKDEQYAFCTGPYKIISGQGTAKIRIVAAPTCIIRFWATSVCQKSNDSVLIYQIINLNHKNNPFIPDNIVLNQAIQPDPNSNSFDGLPAIKVKESFISWYSPINGKGSNKYRICFALYQLDDDGETQNLYGYFYWDFKLINIHNKLINLS